MIKKLAGQVKNKSDILETSNEKHKWGYCIIRIILA